MCTLCGNFILIHFYLLILKLIIPLIRDFFCTGLVVMHVLIIFILKNSLKVFNNAWNFLHRHVLNTVVVL